MAVISILLDIIAKNLLTISIPLLCINNTQVVFKILYVMVTVNFADVKM